MAESNIDRQKTESEPLTVDSELEETVDETIEETPEMSPTFDFKEKSWKTDLTLVVEGTKFYVAKVVLALASPVFERMFESDFKEKASDELELTGKRAEDVNEFLLAVYPSATPVLSKEMALKVLPLAEEYQVDDLKLRCADELLRSINEHTSIKELYDLINAAHLYSLGNVAQRCLHYVCEFPLEDIDMANSEIGLPVEPLNAVLKNVNNRLSSRVNELESSNQRLTEQLETSRSLNKFILNSEGKTANSVLKDGHVWKGRTLKNTLDIKNVRAFKKDFDLWNTKYELTFVLKYEQRNRIIANIKSTDGKKCKLVFQFIVVNKMPSENHHFTNHSAVFSLNNQCTKCEVVPLNRIEDPKKGFVYEGKIQIEMHVFMSEPEIVNS